MTCFSSRWNRYRKSHESYLYKCVRIVALSGLIFEVSGSEWLTQVILWCFSAISQPTDVEMLCLGLIGAIIRNPTNLISTNVFGLWLFPNQFSNFVDQTDCCKMFYVDFLQYLELPMLERRVWGVVVNVRGNSTNLISTNVSVLQLFQSQFSNFVDRNDCRKSFYGVFPQYLELPMSERCVLGVIVNIRGNSTNLISTNVSVFVMPRVLPEYFKCYLTKIRVNCF